MHFSEKAVFQKAEVCLAVDYQMVKEGDSKNICRVLQELCGFKVFLAWYAGAERMVVAADDTRRVLGHRFRKDFPGMNQGAAWGSYRDHADVKQFMCSVEAWADKMLLVLQRKILDVGQDVGGLSDKRLQVAASSSAELKCCRNCQRLCRTDSGDFAKPSYYVFL